MSRDRGAEVDRVEDAGLGLRRELLAQAFAGQRARIGDVGGEDALVVLGEGLDQGRSMRLVVVRRERSERRVATTRVAGKAHRQDAGRQSSPHLGDDAIRVRTGAVELVDEEQGRDVEPLQGAEQERRLGLDAFDRRDDEDRPIEHAEDALDLRDEVGVAGRVDEVDRQVADEERGDRGPDRDAAFALEVERVGLGGAGFDAADAVDRAGGVEETLGEGGLTGVDVGEDAEVERAHGASCRARRSVPSGWTWVLPFRSFLSKSCVVMR